MTVPTLHEWDQILPARTAYKTLAPSRTTPTQPSKLAIAGSDAAAGLCRLLAAQLASFPETIFWDFDFIAARGAVDPSIYDRLTDIYTLYGNASVINFRYTHDFSYGVDWARWVEKDPDNRSEIGPLDSAAIDYVEQRGHELLELIDNNDEKYPKLPNNEARNPYPFSRSPEDEHKLLCVLRDRDLIPLKAWCNQPPQWDLDIANQRREIAAELGLGK